ncbi:hypothetical protein PPTG_17699 [Phytophthora nicotianae INRA-310]|uniref:Uncharacterized protein n=1 Tax=Phytophthora nicotianae (strain INRA-310) TaxID=761204 RepID=W2PIN7_PHYN3|nr:hypothetical protein PPTG_17699 [Phytophthora nicotianae INRA-310]ETN00848.1 hypothetical protein PPTG_17699 [Phytophthora nicotianae INRA-310]
MPDIKHLTVFNLRCKLPYETAMHYCTRLGIDIEHGRRCVRGRTALHHQWQIIVQETYVETGSGRCRRRYDSSRESRRQRPIHDVAHHRLAEASRTAVECDLSHTASVSPVKVELLRWEFDRGNRVLTLTYEYCSCELRAIRHSNCAKLHFFTPCVHECRAVHRYKTTHHALALPV